MSQAAATKIVCMSWKRSYGSPMNARVGKFRNAGRAAICSFALSAAAVGAVEAAESASIVVYHRFGDSGTPGGGIKLAQFEAHLEELKAGGYRVLPLPEIVAAFRDHKPLPDRTVAITIDEGHRSVYSEAWPRLEAAGFPFTIFIATDQIDHSNKDFMSWDEIRALAKAGVTIGSHSASHLHMPASSADENAAGIRASNARFMSELGAVPNVFAYPFGEMSLAVRAEVMKAGYAAAFGQHSGVAYAGGDLYFLPRFTFDETFGDLERFRVAANALPLPVSDVTPADPLTRSNPPAFGFTVDPSVGELKGLVCYSGSARNLKVEALDARRIEVRADQPLPLGRVRINCTLPTQEHRWRWFGTQLYIEKAR
jgi:poly-beta-1,6-N-acetyl-D-glucosamine N-deacetylase